MFTCYFCKIYIAPYNNIYRAYDKNYCCQKCRLHSLHEKTFLPNNNKLSKISTRKSYNNISLLYNDTIDSNKISGESNRSHGCTYQYYNTDISNCNLFIQIPIEIFSYFVNTIYKSE